MRAQTQETPVTTKKLDTSKLVKRNADILKMKSGEKFEGIYKGRSVGPWTDPKTGEVKDLARLHFLIPGTTNRVIIFEDKGLGNALANAMVQVEEHIVIEKHEKVSLAGGRSCNSYDIFAIDAELN